MTVKKKLALFMAIIGCLAITVTGIARHLGGQTMQNNDKVQSDSDVELTASVEKNRFAINEPIVLKLVLRNNGLEERQVISRGPVKDYKIEVKGEHGKTPSLSKAGENLKKDERFSISTGRIALAPNGERSEEIVISDLYDLSSPGTYVVVAKRVGPVVNGKSGHIESNKVTITIE